MNDAEIEELELLEENNRQRQIVIVGAVLLLCLILLLVLLRLAGGQERPLLPIRDAAASTTLVVADNPIRVTFTELNNNPANFIGQTLVVSGEYQPLRPFPCVAPDGPDLRWSLVAENLRLELLGQEQIVRRLSPGTPLVVQGRFERYFGSVGCGKEVLPPQEVWYLRLATIVEPNPLPLGNDVDSFILFDPGQPTAAAEAVVVPPVQETPTTALPQETETAVPVSSEATAVPPTEIAPTIPVASPTINSVETPTSTATLPSSADASPTPVTEATASPTPSPTSTAEPSSGNPTATPNNGGGGGGFITATPGPSPTPGGGYPPPQDTPRPTPYGG